ncbi:sugar ABC transporter permease [Clostridia bacterium]|nr:sugar ABC transporter permease [Clostridia bacterium]
MKKKSKANRLTMGDIIFDAVDVLVMAVICIVIAYPLYYVLVASFTEPHIVTSGKLLLYPEQVYMGGYQRILKYPPIWSGYRNTVLYTVVGTIISLCVTIPGAYALSRKDMAGRRILMFLFTLTMFFSGGIIPLYMLIQKINIYDSIWAVTLPTAVSVWNLIICRTFFESSLPFELYEAAEIDGCSNFGYFFRIALPLSSTVIAVMILFYSTTQWNMFMNALMFLTNMDRMPLQVILRNLILVNQVNQLSTDMTAIAEQQKLADQLKFGIIVVAALPLLCIYPFIQKYFAKGIMIGSIKG